MDNLKNQLIEQIFKILAPLRAFYKDEVNQITNDLLNNDTKSFINFVKKYYDNVSNTKYFSDLVTSLVNNGLISDSFLNEIKVNNSIKEISVRPLNVKITTLDLIKQNKDLSKLDKTKFPVSLMSEPEDIVANDTNIDTNINVDTNSNTTLEIEPDYNIESDYSLPINVDNNEEMPNFSTNYFDNQDDNTINIPAIEIPHDNINNENNLEINLENQDIFSKDDLYKNIEVNEETYENPSLKNTTQFGQLLSFPLKTEQEIPNINNNIPVMENNNFSTPSKDENEIREEIAEEVRDSVRSEIKEELRDEVRDSVKEELRDEVKEEVKEEVRNEVRDSVKNEVKEEVKEEVRASVRSEVKAEVEQELRNQVLARVREETKQNILKLQNDYMNNASEFIKNLDTKSADEIYTSLRFLNDLRYMSHCIMHLSPNTLARLYSYIETKLNSDSKEFMDTIIEKRIKEIIPPNLSFQIDDEINNYKKSA